MSQDQFPTDPTRNYAIPSDNPFVDTNPATFDETYVLGLRNPFTFAIQTDGDEIFINDVGETQWEEINRAVPGANFGWTSEQTLGGFASGFETVTPTYATIGDYFNPVMAYDHGNSAPSPAGCAITGGTFYPRDGSFGPDYGGKFFFADFCGRFIRVFDPARPGSAATPDKSVAFASQLTTGAAVDLKVDSAGRLYYLSRGGTGQIYRIASDALAITSHPDAVAIAPGQDAQFRVAASGASALSYQWQRADRLTPQTFVNIEGATADSLSISSLSLAENGDRIRVIVTADSESIISDAATLTVSVPDQSPSITVQPSNIRVNSGQDATFRVVSSGTAPLSYQWQRADKTNPAQFQIIPNANAAEYTIENAGSSDQGDRFRVVVRNSAGVVASRSAELELNRAPTANITATPTYAFGDMIQYSATATDPEDGVLPASAFTWTIDFGHQSHFHPHIPPASGKQSGTFLADFVEPDPFQYYRIRLEVTDSDGAKHTSFIDVQPETVLLSLVGRPFAVPLLIDGVPAASTERSVVGSVRGIQSPTLHTLGGTEYLFHSWSDGGDASHAITTPSTNATLVAQFEPAPLEVTFENDSILESGGSTTVTVSRRGDISQNLFVELAIDDPTEASGPNSLLIPAGNRSASLTIQGVDDTVLDGPQSVSLSATAVKHSEGRATLHEVDDEGAAITLDVSETSFKEDGGADVSIGTVTRNTETFSPLVVQLQFDDPSEASAPPSVLIPAGESSANFVIAAVDDLLIDGEQVVRLTASADFFASDQKSLFVSDVESWQNPFRPGDVNADGNLSAFDALLIVNELGRRQFSDPDSTRLSPRILEDSPFFDTNGDNHATAIDVLLIINRLTRVTAGDGEEVVHSDHETNHAATDSTALQWDKPKSLNLHPRDLDHAIEVLARDQNRLDVRDLQRDELCRPAPTLF